MCISSGLDAATSSMSMPPLPLTSTTGHRCTESTVMARYSSRPISSSSSTSSWFTGDPSAPVWAVASLFPNMVRAVSSASSGERVTLTPPARPRPPACTWAFKTACPPRSLVAFLASSGELATAEWAPAPRSGQESLWLDTRGFSSPHQDTIGLATAAFRAATASTLQVQ